MSEELPKQYEAEKTEEKWSDFWNSLNCFQADPHSKKPPFCIVIPPPNVTGVLHMGHALGMTLQDTIIRWKRMCGYEALWVPGTDHAGIATQTVVERLLIKETGKRRKDFSREEFLSHVWKWKEKSEGHIVGQIKKLGCSCDWTRQRFTMDSQNNRAVRSVFKSLFDEGLIYRGDYLVNWDPVTQTALADDEVEYEERNSSLWTFRYPLKDQEGHIAVSTTRPETMLGDTAIAVSPKDERYQSLIGKHAIQPLTGRELPIIADPFVDPEFGTGAVKITPAHDPNDYEMGLRHKLPFINIMTPEGHINEAGGAFQGLTMGQARKAVTEAMKSQGLLEKIAPHTLRAGLSYRSKAIIEPYMSKQWFVRMAPFQQPILQQVEDGTVKLVPAHWINTYRHWISNLRDWCISRQLWWGHRIPIWYHVDDPERMICYAEEGLPPEVEKEPTKWRQDEDVLDTWFSSALWPFATLGWPDETPDLKTFYPTSLLITGHDILFFWVARMILMGHYTQGKPPFHHCFLHGLIYGKSYWRTDEKGSIAYLPETERKEYDLGKPIPKDVKSRWEKMSKSKGNVLDPLEISKEYGTDAMRMALCASATSSREIDLDRRKFEEFRNFSNKIWNGARFIFMNLEGDASKGLAKLTAESFSKGIDPSLLALEDRWILITLNRTIQEVHDSLNNYQFDQASQKAYDFFWNEFCAYYLEMAKPVLFGKRGSAAERHNKQCLLAGILCGSLRLLHPMAPFITEELFQRLKEHFGEGLEMQEGADSFTLEAVQALQSKACAIAPYPQPKAKEAADDKVLEEFDLLSKIIYTLRNLKGEMKLPPSAAPKVYLTTNGDFAKSTLIGQNKELLSSLFRTEGIELVDALPSLPFAATGRLDGIQIVLPLPKELLEREWERLEKEVVRLEEALGKIDAQFANEQFVQRAPEALVAKQRALQAQTREELESVKQKLQQR